MTKPLTITKSIPLLVIAFWAIVFFSITHGFNHFTQETNRQHQINQQQPNVAFLKLRDASGNQTNLAALAQSANKTLIVEFIYTQCNALCLSLGGIFQQAQKQILARKLNHQISLVSISFDVERETEQSMHAYGTRFNVDETVWHIATMQDEKVLSLVKEKLGLVVIQDDLKNLIHNSAFMVVNRKGNIVGLFTSKQISQAIALALKQTQIDQQSIEAKSHAD